MRAGHGPGTALSTAALAHAREESAAALESAIGALGAAYRQYVRDTAALSARVGEALAWQLEIPITLHLARAGLAEFLDRKVPLTGRLVSLRGLVEHHHGGRVRNERA